MNVPRQLLPAVISEELRAQLWKDMVSDFSGQTALGFIVYLTGHRIGESALAGSFVLLIVVIVTVKHHRRIRKAKKAAQAAARAAWVCTPRKDF